MFARSEPAGGMVGLLERHVRRVRANSDGARTASKRKRYDLSHALSPVQAAAVTADLPPAFI
jgi:hypothetical protein